MVACNKGGDAAPEPAVAVAPPIDAPPPDSRPPREGLTLHTSVRCAECHGKMEGEWKTSAHARGWRSPVYQAAREQAGDRAAACDRCHAPLAHYAGTDDPAAQEGVTCDVCHNIAEVTPGPRRHRFELTAYDMTKYGPLCDAEPHYFHRMGCSPLHEESELCAACHVYVRAGPAGDVPVYTTYADWKAGPYAEDGVSCQSCHMPGSRAPVAEGEKPRPGVGHHGFFGGDRPLRQRAAGLAVVATPRGDALELEVTVRNAKAGHPIPAGSSDRRIELVARVVDDGGAELAREARTYGRILHDDGGEAPAHRALRMAADTRIGPRQARVERLTLAAPAAGTLEVSLTWYPRSPAIAAALGVEPAEGEVMTRVELPVPAPAARRKPLKKQVSP